MKNTYLTSHFPLLSIIMFSLSFAIYTENYVIDLLDKLGIYAGLIEFFTERGIKITLLFVLLLFFFMVFSALKLIADTIVQISLLFFSKDVEGKDLNKIRAGSWIYLCSAVIALLLSKYIELIVMIFLVATSVYFIYFLYKLNDSLSGFRIVGIVMFHLLFWSSFCLAIFYTLTRLYNGIIASLPL